MGIGCTHETSPGVTTTLRRKPVLGRLPTGRMEGDGTWASADSQSCATIHGATYMSVLCNHPRTYIYVNPVQPTMDLPICQSRVTIHGPTYMSVLCNHPWTYRYVSPVQPSMDLQICQSCATNHGPTYMSVDPVQPTLDLPIIMSVPCNQPWTYLC